MSPRTLTIHADQLEYTSEGLRTPEGLPLEVGAHNELVLERPVLAPAVPLGRGGFGHDSAFPSPAALFGLLHPTLQPLLEPDARPIYQLYGHAQSSGTEAHNKALSERRAEVVLAMLTGDPAPLDAVAQQEGWGSREHQAMLRMLHCDPGPLDGEPGPLTTAAVRDFQEDYLDGIFHRHADAEPRDPTLVPDGECGPLTAAALIDAYVHACSPLVAPEQLHPTHPAVGCSEFNPLLGEDADAPANRRVALVVHRSLPAYHDRAPCLEGDHTACPVDGEQQRCLWYRSHVDEPERSPHVHIDLRWLPLAGGRRVLLSAITSLADGDAVDFQVFRSGPVDGPDDVSADNLDAPLSETLPGIVRLGVAQVIWELPDGFDPFDFDDWYPALAYDDIVANPQLAWSSANRLRPPVFRVRGGGADALSEPPGQQLHRLRLEFEDGAHAREGRVGWGVDNYGRTVHIGLEGRRARASGRAIDERARVMYFEPLHYRPVPRKKVP